MHAYENMVGACINHIRYLSMVKGLLACIYGKQRYQWVGDHMNPFVDNNSYSVYLHYRRGEFSIEKRQEMPGNHNCHIITFCMIMCM